MTKDMQLKYESIEYQKEQYDDKNTILSEFGDWVSATTFYEDIFGDEDIIMPIVIIDDDEEKHIVKMSIGEAIEQSRGRNDILMGGTTYFNGFISKSTAQNIYSFIVDMDNVYSGVLLRSLQHNWKLETGEAVPMPTYIVNSGTGLHLYFVLEEPLPCYKSQIKQIDQLYRRLAVIETTRRVYLRPSVQWFGQDFRMAGGCGKNGWENTVFRVGKKWNVDELARAVGLENVHFVHKRDSLSKPKIENKGKKKGQNRKGYYLNSRVYESSVERCRSETYEGTRYMSMCALSVLGWKCKISREKLESDLLSLIPIYNKNARRLIRQKEIYSAMKMYNQKAMETPKLRTQDWLGWKFKGSKRNGRKRAEHIKLMNFVRDEINGNKDWRNSEGSPNKANIVRLWRKNNPERKKIDCERETGLSRHTVLKWWNYENN